MRTSCGRGVTIGKIEESGARMANPSTYSHASIALAAMLAVLAVLGTAEPPAATGTLEGVVRLGGDSVPGPTLIANTTDPGICGEHQSLQDLLVSEAGRGVANVIVSLVGAPEGASARSSRGARGTLVLDNVDCRFEPHASVLTTGDTIVATNSDEVLHTVHFYGARRGNLSLPRRGITRTSTVDRAGMIVVRCDVHGWMQAFVRVDPHPFHAVSGRDGRFRILDIPPGEHTFEFWHERLGTRTETVRIRPGETTVLEIEYAPESGS